MRKYLLHVLIISFVFILTPTAHVAAFDAEKMIENAKEEVRNNPDEAWAHGLLGNAYRESGKYEEAIESYKQAIIYYLDFPSFSHHSCNLSYLWRILVF